MSKTERWKHTDSSERGGVRFAIADNNNTCKWWASKLNDFFLRVIFCIFKQRDKQMQPNKKLWVPPNAKPRLFEELHALLRHISNYINKFIRSWFQKIEDRSLSWDFPIRVKIDPAMGNKTRTSWKAMLIPWVPENIFHFYLFIEFT